MTSYLPATGNHPKRGRYRARVQCPGIVHRRRARHRRQLGLLPRRRRPRPRDRPAPRRRILDRRDVRAGSRPSAFDRNGFDRRGRAAGRPGGDPVGNPLRVADHRLRHPVHRRGHRPDLRDQLSRAGAVRAVRLGRGRGVRRDRRALSRRSKQLKGELPDLRHVYRVDGTGPAALDELARIGKDTAPAAVHGSGSRPSSPPTSPPSSTRRAPRAGPRVAS